MPCQLFHLEVFNFDGCCYCSSHFIPGLTIVTKFQKLIAGKKGVLHWVPQMSRTQEGKWVWD